MATTRFKLLDLLNVITKDLLQSIITDWSRSLEMPLLVMLSTDRGIIPIPTNPKYVNWCRFCEELRENMPGANDGCIRADEERFKEVILNPYQPEMYQCHNGLVDISFPLVVGGEVLGVFVSGQFRSARPAFEARVKGVIADVKKKHSWWRALKLWYLYKRMPRREQSFVDNVVARLRRKAEDLQAILTKYYEDNVRLAENQFLAEISATFGEREQNISEEELYNIVLSALIEFTGASSGMLTLYDSNQKSIKLWNLENIQNNESAFIQDISVELPVLEAANKHTDFLIFADDCKAILTSLNHSCAGMNDGHLSGLKFALDKHEDVYIILNFDEPVFGIVAGSPFSERFLPMFAVSLRHRISNMRLWVNQGKLLEEVQQRNQELESARSAAVEFMRRVTHSLSIPQSLVMNLAAYLIESSHRHTELPKFAQAYFVAVGF